MISTDCLSIVELGSDFNGLSVHRRARSMLLGWLQMATLEIQYIISTYLQVVTTPDKEAQ